MPCPVYPCGAPPYYPVYRVAHTLLLPATVTVNLAAALTSLMAAALFASGYLASRDEKMGLTAAGFLVLAMASASAVIIPRSLLPPLLYPLGYVLIVAARLSRRVTPTLLLVVYPRVLLDAVAAGLAVAAYAPSPSLAVRVGGALLAISHLLDVAAPAVRLLALLLRGAALLLVSGSIVARSMPRLPSEEAEEA